MRGLFPLLWSRGIEQANRRGDVPLMFLQKEMNTLFEDFFRNFGPHEDVNGFIPRLEVRENEKELTVKVELPGMDEKDVAVSLSGDVLTISGEKKEEKTDEQAHRVETKYGSFRRELAMPQGLVLDKTEAVFAKGVLKITLPKLPQGEETSKKIEIKSE